MKDNTKSYSTFRGRTLRSFWSLARRSFTVLAHTAGYELTMY